MSRPPLTPLATRIALRQKLRIAQETYEGYAAAIVQVKESGKTPEPDLLENEIVALRRVAELSRALLDLIAKG